jgi:hypothetical protein
MKVGPHLTKAVTGPLLLAVLFAGAYGQSPLYSSNQNTYFVQGIALAEGGALQDDWLVSCANHLPVFTALVYAVVKWMIPGVFYFIHGALIAVYAFCLLWLIGRVFKLPRSSPVLGLSLVLLTLMHADFVAEALRSSGLDPLTTLASFFRSTTEGVAGQPLLRHFHQPSAFGVLLLVSICLFVAGKPRLAAVVAAFSPWLHPTYFLAAGLLTLTYIIVDCRERQLLRSFQLGILALAVVLLPLLYTWHEFGPAPAEVATRARAILVHKRFPHHADPHTWFGLSAIFQIIWTIVGLVVARRNRRLLIILTTLCITACTLTLVQVLTASDTLALLLPWRLFVLLVPISTALLVGRFATALLSRSERMDALPKTLRFASYALMVALFVAGLASTKSRSDRAKRPNSLVEFVASQCDRGKTFLVPPHWGGFRLETRCPIFVDWKSHPYRDDEVLEWYARNQLARSFYGARSGNQAVASLERIRDHAPITHVVVKRPSKLPPEYPEARLVFDRGRHLVYQLEEGPAEVGGE